MVKKHKRKKLAFIPPIPVPICQEIKRDLPLPINPRMKRLTLISWSILILFMISAAVYFIGQRKYGLWYNPNRILSQGTINSLIIIGAIIVIITGILTIFTYKSYLTKIPSKPQKKSTNYIQFVFTCLAFLFLIGLIILYAVLRG